MYHWFYNLGIGAYTTAIRLGSFFNVKARAWTEGRKDIWQELAKIATNKDPIVWFHAASLGEAEQGIPIIRKLKKRFPDHKILLSFFSPSGMQNFRQRSLVDYTCYLPADSPVNAERFVALLKPQLAFFIKYEIWANYFLALQKRGTPTIIAPAIFRANHFYFKSPHNKFFIPILKQVNYILTQDEKSVQVLRNNGILNCQHVGDSRFEKVIENTREEFSDSVLEIFANNEPVMVCGSTWEPDEKILLALSKASPQLKMILAPHNINRNNIERVHKLFGKQASFLYSEAPDDISEKRFAIIDNIGMLSKLYRLGEVAYIGGAFGIGIHNSLEAVAYGIPIFFGSNHKNFIEPTEMIELGFAHEISNANELIQQVEKLLENTSELKRQSDLAARYVENGTGATDKIMEVLSNMLK